MSGQRITVFGASGFIGRHVVRRLAAQGWVVRAAVRDVVAAQFLKPMGAVGQIVPMRADVTDAASVARAIEGASAVINLVGILHGRGKRSFAAIHAEAPGRMALAARQAGATRFIHVSAIGAATSSPSAYARSKAEGEALVAKAFPGATILRPSIVFGPEDSFFNRFAALARISPVLPLIGGGRTLFQPVYVGDVADAVMRVLGDPATRGRVYELGGPRVYSFRALMEFMLASIGRRRWLLNLPVPIAMAQASVLQCLPAPPLTVDQVRLLQRDNVVAPGMPGLPDLGIQPATIELIVPGYLDRFRIGGRFAKPSARAR
jgi:uncharacterized protein YbjT (DUF2867 family)